MTKRVSLLFSFFFLTLTFLTIANPASAQDDPPGRVARLSYMQGSVSFQASGSQDWIEANPNRPMTTGDDLWSDKHSRAEVHIGSTAIRLASETGISFLNLDDRTVQIQLAQGAIEVHLRHHDPGNAFEIDTPNLAFQISTTGEYRIQTDSNGDSTTIIVHEGAGEVTGGGDSYILRAGQSYTFNGTEELSYDAQPDPGFDSFGDWCQERDQRENRALSARYVSRDVDGYYDLDDYGDWQNDPDYGAIWIPRSVVAGWAPYHFGHWVWIAPWGWTWVDDAPWGFAPFHYGRWAYVRGYWGWVPGPIVVRPYYAPALVAFVGGGGWGVSIGFGSVVGVGWFPLGPRDVWVPGYRCSPRYVQTINVTNTRVVNVTQVTNVYNNYYVKNVKVTNYTYQSEVHAVTVVRREDFVNALPTRQAVVNVQTEQIRTARVVDERPLAPTRQSYVSATAKPVPPAVRPTTTFYDRRVVTKINPPIPPAGGHQAQIVDAEKKPVVTPPPPAPKNQPEFVERGKPNNPPPPPPKNEPGSNQPAKEYNPPAAKVNTPPPPNEKTYQRGENQPYYEQHPGVKYTPPVKAKDEMYDVHPPLNQKPLKTEERKSEPPPPPPPKQQKDEHHNESKPSR